MKILFFTETTEDYLADSILHGFRSLFGKDCVDFPKCDILYKNCSEETISKVRGKGFTLYSGLLDDIEIDRYNISEKIKAYHFDLIVFSNIQRQYGYFIQYRPWLTGKNTIILDGEDTPYPYPARGLWWRKSYYWSIPNAHKNFLYFKREWTEKTRFSILSRLTPNFFKKYLQPNKNLRTISFAIPSEKIITQSSLKTQNFPKHIVDDEVASHIENSNTQYAFSNEIDYYEDLQKSKFGITVKRAGWDCLRHYEIAANGAVMCFKDLHKKPKFCAPHGLNSSNTLSYESYEDLMTKMRNLSDSQYSKLRSETLKWISNNTTVAAVENILVQFKEFN